MHTVFSQEAYSVFDVEQRGLVNAADPETVGRIDFPLPIQRANPFQDSERTAGAIRPQHAITYRERRRAWH